MKNRNQSIRLQALIRIWPTLLFLLVMTVLVLRFSLRVLTGTPPDPSEFDFRFPTAAFTVLILQLAKMFLQQPRPKAIEFIKLPIAFAGIGVLFFCTEWLAFNTNLGHVFLAAIFLLIAIFMVGAGYQTLKQQQRELTSQAISSKEFLKWYQSGERDFRKSNFFGMVANEADLHGIDLESSDLGSADLRGADLRGANLTNVRLDGANLENAQVNQEQLDQAGSLVGTILPDGIKHA